MLHFKISGNRLFSLSLKPIFVCGKASLSDQRYITCTMIPGDGIGSELCNAVRQVFKVAKVPVKFEKHTFSQMMPERSESLENVVNAIRRTKVCLHGIVKPSEQTAESGFYNWNLKLRDILELYANVVNIKSFKGVQGKYGSIDIAVIRHYTDPIVNTNVKGITEPIKMNSQIMIKKIVKFAFEYAIEHNKTKVTAVHKAISDVKDDVFLETCINLSTSYPNIEFKHMSIGNCAMMLRSQPQYFEVIVTPHMYGSIIEPIGAGLVGGPAMLPASCCSSRCVIFELGGRYSYYANMEKNIVNPTGILLSSINLLKHLELHECSRLIKDALYQVLEEGKVKTKDIGGKCSTTDFVEEVIDKLDLNRELDEVPSYSLRRSSFVYRINA